MHYYIISGESSGDFYGSKLIQSIKKSDKKAKFTCWGGINMKNQNVELVQSLNNLSFVGFWEVFLNIKTIIKNFFLLHKSIRETKPDLIILIDYPDLILELHDSPTSLIYQYFGLLLHKYGHGRRVGLNI